MNQFAQIREAWARNERRVLRAAREGRGADPYFMDWPFTPIERCAWQSIRGTGIPFFPQYPALRYFIDFADPHKRIGLECDGKDFHDARKDQIRDRRLKKHGWTIYRATGAECVRQYDCQIVEDGELDPDCCGADYEANYRRYAFETIDGLVDAIAEEHYGISTKLREGDSVAILKRHRGA